MSNNDTEKTTILLKALELSQVNQRHYADRAQYVHSWIGSMFMASIGAIAALGPDKVAGFGAPLRIGLTLVVCTLLAFSWVTEYVAHRARFRENEAGMRIGKLLHLFNPGYFDDQTVIFEESAWIYWQPGSWRLLISPGTAVLAVMVVVLVVLIWIA